MFLFNRLQWCGDAVSVDAITVLDPEFEAIIEDTDLFMVEKLNAPFFLANTSSATKVLEIFDGSILASRRIYSPSAQPPMALTPITPPLIRNTTAENATASCELKA